MYTNTNRYSDDPSNLRFIAEMDSHEGFWLVFDTKLKTGWLAFIIRRPLRRWMPPNANRIAIKN